MLRIIESLELQTVQQEFVKSARTRALRRHRHHR